MTKTELNSLYGMRKNILSSKYGIQSNRGVRSDFWVRFWPAGGRLMSGRCVYADTDSLKILKK